MRGLWNSLSISVTRSNAAIRGARCKRYCSRDASQGKKIYAFVHSMNISLAEGGLAHEASTSVFWPHGCSFQNCFRAATCELMVGLTNENVPQQKAELLFINSYYPTKIQCSERAARRPFLDHYTPNTCFLEITSPSGNLNWLNQIPNLYLYSFQI